MEHDVIQGLLLVIKQKDLALDTKKAENDLLASQLQGHLENVQHLIDQAEYQKNELLGEKSLNSQLNTKYNSAVNFNAQLKADLENYQKLKPVHKELCTKYKNLNSEHESLKNTLQLFKEKFNVLKAGLSSERRERQKHDKPSKTRSDINLKTEQSLQLLYYLIFEKNYKLKSTKYETFIQSLSTTHRIDLEFDNIRDILVFVFSAQFLSTLDSKGYSYLYNYISKFKDYIFLKHFYIVVVQLALNADTHRFLQDVQSAFELFISENKQVQSAKYYKYFLRKICLVYLNSKNTKLLEVAFKLVQTISKNIALDPHSDAQCCALVRNVLDGTPFNIGTFKLTSLCCIFLAQPESILDLFVAPEQITLVVAGLTKSIQNFVKYAETQKKTLMVPQYIDMLVVCCFSNFQKYPKSAFEYFKQCTEIIATLKSTAAIAKHKKLVQKFHVIL